MTYPVFNADSGSFGVNATLVYGETEALLVDTGFTKVDALRIAAKVLDSKKTLTTIFISQADPDYYFSVEVMHALCPEAKIITTSAVKVVIEKNLQVSWLFLGPKMGANAPVKPIIPDVYQHLGLDPHIMLTTIQEAHYQKGESLDHPEVLKKLALSLGLDDKEWGRYMDSSTSDLTNEIESSHTLK